MAYSFNHTIIIGRLGEDPKLKIGDKVESCCFTICNSTFSDGVEEVQWHDLVAFGKQARVCAEHLHKGDLCCVEGRIDSKKYIKDGEEMYAQAIIAERITFLSPARPKKDVQEQETEPAAE